MTNNTYTDTYPAGVLIGFTATVKIGWSDEPQTKTGVKFAVEGTTADTGDCIETFRDFHWLTRRLYNFVSETPYEVIAVESLIYAE